MNEENDRMQHPVAAGALVRAMLVVAVLVALGCAAGAPVPATYLEQTTADEPQYLLSAISLVEDHDLDIADELAAQRWRAFHEANLPEQTKLLADGRRLSPHDPLLPLLLAVPVALGGWVGAKLALAVLAGLLAAVLVWTAVRRLRVPLGTAVLVTLVLCLSPPLAVYGTQVYPELPAALAVAVALAALTGPLRTRGCLLAGAAVVTLPWLGVKYAPVAAVLAVLATWRLWREGRRTAVLAWLGGLGVAGVAFALVHLAVYGGLTPYAVGDEFTTGELGVVGAAPNYAGRSVRLVGLLVDRAFGLVAWQPAWLLTVPALAALARRRPDGWAVLAAPAAVGWLVATFVALTMQGWWWPGRQVVVVLPALVLVLAWWVGVDAPRWRARALALAGAAEVAGYFWMVVEGAAGRITWVFDFFDTGWPGYRLWRVLLPDYLAPTGWTWLLHGLWIAVVAALALAGWRQARPERKKGGPQAALPVMHQVR
jgi:hypothetical protein